MAAVFIPQKVLDAWIDQGKIELNDDTLTLLKEERTVNLNPAVRFRSLLGADDDPHKLIGKVKTHSQLADLDAEHYMDSVILGDVAYQVEEGFMGDLSRKKSSSPVASSPVASSPVASSPVASSSVDVSVDDDVKTSPPTAADALPNVPRPVSVPPFASEVTSTSATESEVVEETDAEALSKLFLDTVQ